jgi:hypothetical protein
MPCLYVIRWNVLQKIVFELKKPLPSGRGFFRITDNFIARIWILMSFCSLPE